jgi:hypothetical protein
MAQIQKILQKEKDLTIFIITGELEYEEIIDMVDQTYSSEITLNILMDLSSADTKSLTSEQIERIGKHSKKYSHLRIGGKTAYIVSKDIDFGLARMYQIHTELNGHHEAHGVFRNMDEAMAWLNG